MVVRNISEAKAELSALIKAVQNGNEVIIAKAGKPVARLVAFRGPARPRTPGSMAGDSPCRSPYNSNMQHHLLATTADTVDWLLVRFPGDAKLLDIRGRIHERLARNQ